MTSSAKAKDYRNEPSNLAYVANARLVVECATTDSTSIVSVATPSGVALSLLVPLISQTIHRIQRLPTRFDVETAVITHLKALISIPCASPAGAKEIDA